MLLFIIKLLLNFLTIKEIITLFNIDFNSNIYFCIIKILKNNESATKKQRSKRKM